MFALKRKTEEQMVAYGEDGEVSLYLWTCSGPQTNMYAA